MKEENETTKTRREQVEPSLGQVVRGESLGVETSKHSFPAQRSAAQLSAGVMQNSLATY